VEVGIDNTVIEKLMRGGVLTAADVELAELMCRLATKPGPELGLATALAGQRVAENDVCLDLAAIAQTELKLPGEEEAAIVCPDLASWEEALLASGVVGRPEEQAMPLLLDAGHRLYLRRYFEYERSLARELLMKAEAETEQPNREQFAARLLELFENPRDPDGKLNGQMAAAWVALNRKLCVITGGPGTGKTTTVAAILVLLAENIGPECRFALVAPTGKAAARLGGSIREAKERLKLNDAQADLLPDEAFTIHRLLGTRHNSPYFYHNRERPLNYDVVVVDEASMVDLPLAAKLVDALGEDTRLIILGDKDQLASVQAGAVLGDICADRELGSFREKTAQAIERDCTVKPPVSERATALDDCIVELTRSWRFDEKSAIGRVSAAVNRADGAKAHAIAAKGGKDATWRDLPARKDVADVLGRELAEGYRDYSDAVERHALPDEVLEAFESFRVLCALNEGSYGVDNVNSLIARRLFGRGDEAGQWYPGRPVMVVRNDAAMRLFNGDVGIALPNSQQNGKLQVFFRAADGRLRNFPPVRIPEHRTAFAITIHKSQGSEFERVALIFPPVAARVMTGELIYTGITRAKGSIALWGDREAFLEGVRRRIERTSGLRDALKMEFG
jgi:exodeoxyribonuclease V alpha subunit